MRFSTSRAQCFAASCSPKNWQSACMGSDEARNAPQYSLYFPYNNSFCPWAATSFRMYKGPSFAPPPEASLYALMYASASRLDADAFVSSFAHAAARFPSSCNSSSCFSNESLLLDFPTLLPVSLAFLATLVNLAILSLASLRGMLSSAWHSGANR